MAMADKAKALTKELAELKADIDKSVERAACRLVRDVEKKYSEARQELEDLRQHQIAVMTRRRHADAKAEAVAAEARASIQKLEGDVAVFKNSLAQALRDSAMEKNVVRDLRRENGVLRGLLTKSKSAIAELDAERDELLDAVAEEEERACAAEAAARAAEVDAADARQQLECEAAEAAAELDAAQSELDTASYERKLLALKLARAQARKEDLLAPPPRAHLSRDEQLEVSRDAERQRTSRRRTWLKGVLVTYSFTMADVAWVVADLEKTEELFKTKPVITEHIKRVRMLMKTIERDHLGQRLALFMHFEMHLTTEKIARINSAGSMAYSRSTDSNSRCVIAYNPFVKSDVVKMPRLAPPRSKLQPLVQEVAASLGITPAENGRVATLSFTTVVQEMLSQDVGLGDMPPLPFFMGGAHDYPICVSTDATGFGKQQLTTSIARNPYRSKSANLNRFLGLGNCDDGRSGKRRLLGPNLDTINEYFHARRDGRLVPLEIEVSGQLTCVEVKPHLLVTDDLSSVRHTEHIANSGLCGCSREKALRVIPKKPANVAEMRRMLKEDCISHTLAQRVNWSHTPRRGQSLPDPCTHAGCKFGKNPSFIPQEYRSLLDDEAKLEADDSKAGRSRFSKWRMAHAHAHSNVQPGKYGAPFFEHDLDDQIFDPLHNAELGLPKTPWKHGVLFNASDEGREQISAKLAEFKHPLDCRRKEDGRVRQDKWFTGAAWRTFVMGERGSPGGPRALANLVMILAEDLQQNGVSVDGEGRVLPPALEADNSAPPPAAKKKKASSRDAFLSRTQATAATATSTAVTPAAALATQARAQRIPSDFERACDPQDLQIIHDVYGSRAQELPSHVSFFRHFCYFRSGGNLLYGWHPCYFRSNVRSAQSLICLAMLCADSDQYSVGLRCVLCMVPRLQAQHSVHVRDGAQRGACVRQHAQGHRHASHLRATYH